MGVKKGRIFVGGLVVLVAATVWGPDLRLAHELAAARSEGLWTGAADVRRAVGDGPDRDNAGPLVQKLTQEDRKETRLDAAFLDALTLATSPALPPAERAAARARLDGPQGILARWRTVSLLPKLDYHRDYAQGYRVLFPEIAAFRAAANRFIVAASSGLDPRANLVVAARLSALMRSEPGVLVCQVGVAVGDNALAAAERKGCARAVEAALGPSTDVRRVLGPELPAFLDSADYGPYLDGLRDLGIQGDPSWGERLLHSGPFVRSVKAAGVARWRTLWARLPKDGTDYDGAARVVDEELPKIDALMPTYADVMARLLGGGKRGDFLRRAGDFERRRARVRAEGEIELRSRKGSRAGRAFRPIGP